MRMMKFLAATSSLQSFTFTSNINRVSYSSLFLHTQQLNSGMTMSSTGISTAKPEQAYQFWLLLTAVVMSKMSFQVSERYYEDTWEKSCRRVSPSLSRALGWEGKVAGSARSWVLKLVSVRLTYWSQLQSFQRTTLLAPTKLLSHIQWFLKAQPQTIMMASKLLDLSMYTTNQEGSIASFSLSAMANALFPDSSSNTSCTIFTVWVSCARVNSPQDWYSRAVAGRARRAAVRIRTSMDIAHYKGMEYYYQQSVLIYQRQLFGQTHRDLVVTTHRMCGTAFFRLWPVSASLVSEQESYLRWWCASRMGRIVGRSSISSLGCGSWREMVCAHLRLSLMSVGLWVKRNCIVELGVSDNYMHNIIAQTEQCRQSDGAKGIGFPTEKGFIHKKIGLLLIVCVWQC